MREGSSRGPYFNRGELLEALGKLSEILVSLIGSRHPFNIDVIGGGATGAMLPTGRPVDEIY